MQYHFQRYLCALCDYIIERRCKSLKYYRSYMHTQAMAVRMQVSLKTDSFYHTDFLTNAINSQRIQIHFELY